MRTLPIRVLAADLQSLRVIGRIEQRIAQVGHREEFEGETNAARAFRQCENGNTGIVI